MNSSDVIVFLGDSITEMGDGKNGYVRIVRDSLKKKLGDNAPRVKNAGISGNKVTDLQVRLERDVLSNKPTLVVVYIGINDVWHFSMPGGAGTPEDVYESGLNDVVRRLLNSGAKVILCTPSVIGEKAEGSNPQDQMLGKYVEMSRSVASRNNVALCDLHERFVDYLGRHNRDDAGSGILTIDGVHLNDEGNRLVAGELLEMIPGPA